VQYSAYPKSASILVHRKPANERYSRGRAFTNSSNAFRNILIFAYEAVIGNFKLRDMDASGDLAALMIRAFANDPFEKVATSLVAA
jgi:hypothetical protein